MARKSKENPDQLSFFDNSSKKEKEVLSKKELRKRGRKIASELGLKVVQKDETLFLEHPLLKESVFEARPYALRMVQEVFKSSFLNFLDTELGKTFIEALLSILYLREHPKKKILLLAPVKVLCDQHTKVFSEDYLEKKVDKITTITNIPTGLITGYIKEENRLKVWQENSLIIATPQTIVLELEKDSGVGKKEDVGFVIFDEVHNLSGEYAYKDLSEYYKQGKVFLGGFTASLPGKSGRLEKLMKSLGAIWENLIIGSSDDPEIAAYRFEPEKIVRFIKQEKNELYRKLKKLLMEQLNFYVKRFVPLMEKNRIHFDAQKSFYLNQENEVAGIAVKEFVKIQKRIMQKYEPDLDEDTRYQLLISWSLIMLANSSLESLNKGFRNLQKFFESKYYSEDKKHTTKIFLNLFRIKEVLAILYTNGFWSRKDLEEDRGVSEYLPFQKKINVFNYLDSKLLVLEEIVKTFSQKTNVIVFFESREVLLTTKEFLRKKFPELVTEELKGQTYKYKDPGMNIKKQQDVARRFRNKEINILLSTSVGEQGLDFKSVDLVILYNPISSIIRIVQIMGRTSRHRKGRIYFLVYDIGAERKIYNTYKRREKEVLKAREEIIKIKNMKLKGHLV